MISDACAPYLFIRTHARSLARSHARSLTEACGHGFAEAHLDLVGLWQHRRCSPAGALRKLGRLFAQDLLAPMPRCSQTSLSRLLSHFVPCSPTLFPANSHTLTLSPSTQSHAPHPCVCVCAHANPRTRTVTHLHTAWAHRARTQGRHRDDTGTTQGPGRHLGAVVGEHP